MELLAQTQGFENIQLVVAGDGEDEGKIRDRVAELGIDLRLAGYKQEEQTIELYHASDAFFLPSFPIPVR